MHKYLMKIRHYFSGYEEFVIEAENKIDALEKAKLFVSRHWKYNSNYDRDNLHVVKKMKK